MNREHLALTGVFGAAVLAASCCLAPGFFIFFGVSVGALAQLTVLDPYRPIFIGAGVLALASAGWWIYGRQPATDCADGVCSPDAARPGRTRFLFWVSATVFAVAIVYPYALSAYLSGGEP